MRITSCRVFSAMSFSEEIAIKNHALFAMDDEEILHLLRPLEDESDLDSADVVIAVVTVEQQLEGSNTEQDTSADEDDSGDVSS